MWSPSDTWYHVGCCFQAGGPELVKEITPEGKKKNRLTPNTFSLLHATDFADRYERNFADIS